MCERDKALEAEDVVLQFEVKVDASLTNKVGRSGTAHVIRRNTKARPLFVNLQLIIKLRSILHLHRAKVLLMS